MSKLVLILGGTRSGKSTFAVQLAKSKEKVASIATAGLWDDPEMKQRIEEHRKLRPAHWLTVEEPMEVERSLVDLKKKVEVVVIDCMTLLITNWILKGTTKIENLNPEDYLDKEKFLLDKVKNLTQTAKEIGLTVIIVSNEVGMSIHPETRLGRFFRDIAGWANQILAEAADEVYLMTAGIPLKIKG